MHHLQGRIRRRGAVVLRRQTGFAMSGVDLVFVDPATLVDLESHPEHNLATRTTAGTSVLGSEGLTFREWCNANSYDAKNRRYQDREDACQ